MSQIEELQQQFHDARAAAEAYSDEITAKYAAEYPPEVDKEGKTLPITPERRLERARAWTAEESAELARLRTVAREAALALHRARQAAGGA